MAFRLVSTRASSDTLSPGASPESPRYHRSIELTPIKDRLSENWDHYAEAVYLISEQTIRRWLKPGERVERNSHGFDVYLDRPDANAANRRIDDIAEAMTALFFGTEPDADGPPEAKSQVSPARAGNRKTRGKGRRSAPHADRSQPKQRGSGTATARRKARGDDIAAASKPDDSSSAGPTRQESGNKGGPERTAHESPEAGAGAANEQSGSVLYAITSRIGSLFAKKKSLKEPNAPSAPTAPSLTDIRKAIAAAETRRGATPSITRSTDESDGTAPRGPDSPPATDKQFTEERPPAARNIAVPRPVLNVAGESFLTHKKSAEIAGLEQAIMAAIFRQANRQLKDPVFIRSQLEKIRVTYRPLWNVPSRRVNFFAAIPVFPDDEKPLIGEEILSWLRAPEATRMLDQILINHVMLDCVEMFDSQDAIGVALPIHFSTLTDEWSSRPVLDALDHFPDTVRRSLFLDFVDAREGRTDDRFPDCVRRIKPHCMRVAGRVPINIRDLRYLRELGFSTATTDVRGWNGSEEDLINQLKNFLLTARQQGLRTVVMGLQSRSTVLAAATMGFDAIQGSLITQSAWGSLFDSRPLDYRDLYPEIAQDENPLWQV